MKIKMINKNGNENVNDNLSSKDIEGSRTVFFFLFFFFMKDILNIKNTNKSI